MTEEFKKNNGINEDQLENVSGGYTEAELEMMRRKQEKDDFMQQKWDEAAEMSEWQRQEEIRRYKEKQDAQKKAWGIG